MFELDRQLTEAERENEILQEKINRLEADNREASAKVDNVQVSSTCASESELQRIRTTTTINVE